MTVFFTSDTHYGHANIIKYCNRPFNSVEHMNNQMIANWNNRVSHDDIVYHVGDFAFMKNHRSILDRLNGSKHIVLGNHDKGISKDDGWASISNYKEITVEGQTIILCHYAMRVWNKSHRGSWMLYGHSHGSLPDDKNALSIDVGVDCHNYAPISFDEIKRLMSKKTFKPVDHHGG